MLQEFDAGELARMVGGNAHYNQVLVEGLDPDGEHTLEIQPVFADNSEQELRIESICVAGGRARVSPQSLRVPFTKLERVSR